LSTRQIDAALCARMFLAGAASLESKKDWINELNVFPVPDGDTGTNMSMTIMSAVREVEALDEVTMKSLAKAMSSGSLRGARGNSGVILSQILRGFGKGIRDCELLDPAVLTEAFQKGTETAYKAVMKPKEGTILTVARCFAEKAAQLYEENPEIELEPFLEGAIASAQEALDQTPELLPVLKEAGVVDSGGAGLLAILTGAYDRLTGKVSDEVTPEQQEELARKQAELENTYCVECVLVPKEPAGAGLQEELTFRLKEMGESVFVLYDEGSAKLHVHTKRPGEVISFLLESGRLSRVKVQALSEGHRETVITDAERERAKILEEEKAAAAAPLKEVGFISVSVGEGLGRIFKDLGVDCLIEGGQTMNPSTEDMLAAIEKVHAKNIFILPNNKNIILAATQAQGMVKDRTVFVIPTRTIPQGITAMIAYAPEKTPLENEKDMFESISLVKTCQMTYSIRDTHIDDLDIHEGDIMGVGDHKIIAVGQKIAATTLEAVSSMVDESSELISVYYGQDVTEEDAQELAAQIQDQHPDCEVELQDGGQPIYYYIISVE